MLKNTNPTQTQAWKNLDHHFQQIKDKHMLAMFAENENRFDQFSTRFQDILLDYSKNRIDHTTLNLLKDLALELELPQAIEAQFSGEKINKTEQRAVLHTALRNKNDHAIQVDGEDIKPLITSVLDRTKAFSERVIQGEWKGYTGKSIEAIVNIGIGGSDLGPVMVTEALKPYKNHLEIHFISNVDGTHISETLKKVDPETTLFVVASKSFSTQETMTNAHSARDWFLANGAQSTDIAKHFIALSTNKQAVG